MNIFCRILKLITTRIGEAIDAGCELFDLDAEVPSPPEPLASGDGLDADEHAPRCAIMYGYNWCTCA